eukprot:COSAG02_NODE_4321_length_5506_cov_63.368599_2_plen_101_part_00
MWTSACRFILIHLRPLPSACLHLLTCATVSKLCPVSPQRVKWTNPPAVSAADLVCLIAGVETRREASVVVSELKDRLLASNAVAYCTIKVGALLIMADAL